MIVLFSGNMQRVIVVSSHRPHVGAVLQQQHGDVDVAETRRDVQRRLALAGLRLHRRAVAQQDAYYVRLLTLVGFPSNI